MTAQRILAAHQRPDGSDHWPGLHLDLSGATLVDANFSDCELYEAKFSGTAFTGAAAMFVRTAFTGVTRFTYATFQTSAAFDGATFAGRLWFDAVTLVDYIEDSVWPEGWVAEAVADSHEDESPNPWRRLVRTAESAR